MRDKKRLVLDANILLRAVFGVRVRTLLETYEDAARFFTPDICFEDAEKYLEVISAARNLDVNTGHRVLSGLMNLVETVDRSLYEEHESTARERMRSRDIADWPIAATSLLLDCPIWTEDQDFFGSGIATWTTVNVEFYLRNT
ncbi:nucleotide-binding protein [Acidobacteria bacterium AB60]|nr:nucleotide-binding protein [Acidobacteria bacterium AB60]